MSGNRVAANDIRVGHPLPWDVFDANGTLLLRRGYIIDTQRALDRLIDDGLFLSAEARREPPPPPVEEKPSALQYLVDARRLIGPPTQDLEAIRDFPGRVLRIAQLIDLACQSKSDVAIASILLMQDDSYALRHHINTAILSNLIARAMALPPDQIRSLTAAALTMNISMYEIQDQLHEVKGPLNERIRALIHAHPNHSEQRLRKFGVTDPYWLKCVQQHHEYENGGGYPLGLAGAAIEPGAKIIGLADRYCARISIRNYRPTQPPNAVLRDLYIEKGAEIDPIIAAYLLRVLGVYPPGTIVRLRNAEVAVVVTPTDNVDAPIAYAVLGPSGAALAIPSVRKTALDAYRIMDVVTRDKVDFPIQMSRLWGGDARLA
ncbi:MAG: HD domain-containing phosphohydrolase [Rhodocyclaceae bacterium]|nr:HD domain-containing phosphohydrolase [Rhodocyclaceae bacterium]